METLIGLIALAILGILALTVGADTRFDDPSRQAPSL